MKHLTFAISLGAAIVCHGQELDPASTMEDALSNMFEIEPAEPYIPEGIQGPLNPAVPLDGGLTALLVAGGAVGYRKYRARSTKR
jgi:hypothetical protein